MGLLKYFVPKKKNQAHLPDDKNPSVSTTWQFIYHVVEIYIHWSLVDLQKDDMICLQ